MHDHVLEHKDEDLRGIRTEPDPKQGPAVMVLHVGYSQRYSESPIAKKGDEGGRPLLSKAGDDTNDHLGEWLHQNIEGEDAIGVGDYPIHLL